MASKEKQHKQMINIKIYKKNLDLEKKKELDRKIETLNLTYNKNKDSEFHEIQIPISIIFYIEYLNNKIKYHFRTSAITLIDERNKSLNEIQNQINNYIHKSDIWSKFIRIKSYYLIRKGDIRGFDYNEQKVLLSSVTHQKKIAQINVSSVYKKELFENIKSISKGLLSIKSTQNIEYIIFPQNIRGIESHSKSKKIFLENNLFTKLIEVKVSKSSKNIKEFFSDEYKTLFSYGMFIKPNRSIIFNLLYLDKSFLKDNIYDDIVMGKNKMDSQILKKII